MMQIPTLVLHIGIGKTGSTAIQNALSKSTAFLDSKLVQYWGLNLEHVKSASSERYPWQLKTGTEKLLALDQQVACEQVESAIRKALVHLPSGGVGIWSNESLYAQSGLLLPVVTKLLDEGNVHIRVIACVRSLSRWLPSAYRQWGVRHKTYPGRVRSFLTWAAESESFLRFGSKLSAWDHGLGERFELINYDSSDNIVTTFMKRLGVWSDGCTLLQHTRDYATPGATQLALWALVNHQSDSPVAPTAIQRLLQSAGLLQRKYHRFNPEKLVVTKESVNIVEKTLVDDQALVNEMLQRRGEPMLLQDSTCIDEGPPVDTTQLLALLADLLISQHQRIEALEKNARLRS